MTTTYVVDTNIVFSAVLRMQGSIAELLINTHKYGVRFIAPAYLKEEIEVHFDRLVELTGIDAIHVRRAINIIYERIDFIADGLIPIRHYAIAAELLREIDPRDINFVALSSSQQEVLFTGDLKLFNGLLSKGYLLVTTFQLLREKHNIL